ncbi:E3 ubiquitin-protein ligase UBR1-like isoform X2 [Uranotaenia lowii]|nr:E3 ubiquitin-protein ligase UBR1-like isoform X2 [Uranotaenia lowii]
MIVNLLQCDVMLLVFKTVFKQALNLKAVTFSESHVQRVLYLLGYALQEEDSRNYPFLKFIERSNSMNIWVMLEELVNNPRVQSQRDLILWVLQKYKDISIKSDDVTCRKTSCSEPESLSSTQLESEKLEKQERAKLAAKRRAQILAQMENAQKNFMTSNAELFEMSNDNEDNMKSATCMDWTSGEEQPIGGKACIGKNRITNRHDESLYRCILCSEESAVSKHEECMIYASFVQKSSVLSRYQQTDDSGQLRLLETSTHPSPHVSTCGHVMHATCFEKYFNNEVMKENRRPYRHRTPVLFDVEKKEFLCPLCRFLSNALLPLLPPLGTFEGSSTPLKVAIETIEFDKWCDMTNLIFSAFRETNNKMQTQDVMEFDDLTTMSERTYDEIITKNLSYIFGECDEDCKLSKDPFINKSIFDFVEQFCTSVYDVAPFPTNAKKFDEYIVTWLSCAYTIESLEMLLRATERPLGNELSIRYTACLSGFVRVSSIVGSNIKTLNPSFINYLCDLYDSLFGKKKSAFLEWDIFSMLTTMIFSTRCVLLTTNKEDTIPKGSVFDHNIFLAMFLIHTARIVVSHDMSSSAMQVEESIEEKQFNLLSMYKNYNIHNQHGAATSIINILNVVKQQSITFLRCSSLLFHAITDIELPCDDSFDVYALYLGMNSDLNVYFENPIYYEFVHRLIETNLPQLRSVKHNIHTKKAEDIVPLVQEMYPVRQLIDLPDDYSDLINSVSLFMCPNNIKDDSRNPTMCLVCGEILCSQSFCCQKELDRNSVGSCTYHAHTCGAGIGIFLRIRDCEILLLGINKGCFISAPYIDEYGETDQGLRRGNPLRLCKERYKKLHIIWLGHGIHEEITRKTETQQTLFATQWQNL